ncbi:hypothetical protein BYT27DRAFT_7034719, partial [Phlegmacium glaucopus]
YEKWAKSTGFLSMLPKDSAAQKVAEVAAVAKLHQGRVDQHFEPVKPGDKPSPYSDKIFRDAAIQWLVQTDQPIQALKHPAFQEMIWIAVQATREVKI